MYGSFTRQRGDGIVTKQLCTVSHLYSNYFKVPQSFYTWYQTQFSFVETIFTTCVSLITNRESHGKLASTTNTQLICENQDSVAYLSPVVSTFSKSEFQNASNYPPRSQTQWKSKVATMTFFQNASNGKGMKFNRNQKRMDGQRQTDSATNRMV